MPLSALRVPLEPSLATRVLTTLLRNNAFGKRSENCDDCTRVLTLLANDAFGKWGPGLTGNLCPAAHLGFKLPGYRPSDMDKKILIWSGRFKTVDQIPEFVSFEMIDASRNRMRVKACYIMMATTIAACLITVILGKRAAGRHESLTGQNMEKKAKWRQEFQLQQQEAASAAAMSGKAQ